MKLLQKHVVKYYKSKVQNGLICISYIFEMRKSYIACHSSIRLDLVVVFPVNLGLVVGLISATTSLFWNILGFPGLQHLAVVFGNLHLHVR